jgi:23S rRNA pseudouridine2605 synthase
MNKSRNSAGNRKSGKSEASSNRGKSSSRNSRSTPTNKYTKATTSTKRSYGKREEDQGSERRYAKTEGYGSRPGSRGKTTPAKRSYGKREEDQGSERRYAKTEGYGSRPGSRGKTTPAKRSYGKREEDQGSERRYAKTEGYGSRPGSRGKTTPAKRSYGKREEDQGSERRYAKTQYSKTGTSRNEKPRYESDKKEKIRGKYGKATREMYEEEEAVETNTRLNKYIANAGVCARREADKLIGAGLVSVNGEVITEMGFQVKPGDDVRYNGTRLSTDKKVYLVMNKPKDAICTLDDPEGRTIVTDLIDDRTLPRVYTIGRLDRNTTGVLLLTNDGELSQRLMHPKFQVQKIYKATLNKAFKGEHLWDLSNGIELEDGLIKVDSIAVPETKIKNEVVIEIHSGRNRIIHRMFEHLGYVVDRLDRVWYAGFDKRGLKRGQWRHLTDKELTRVKKLVKLA